MGGTIRHPVEKATPNRAFAIFRILFQIMTLAKFSQGIPGLLYPLVGFLDRVVPPRSRITYYNALA